jgi:hypothetical protein
MDFFKPNLYRVDKLYTGLLDRRYCDYENRLKRLGEYRVFTACYEGGVVWARTLAIRKSSYIL